MGTEPALSTSTIAAGNAAASSLLSRLRLARWGSFDHVSSTREGVGEKGWGGERDWRGKERIERG